MELALKYDNRPPYILDRNGVRWGVSDVKILNSRGMELDEDVSLAEFYQYGPLYAELELVITPDYLAQLDLYVGDELAFDVPGFPLLTEWTYQGVLDPTTPTVIVRSLLY